jgi:hypothetical protein
MKTILKIAVSVISVVFMLIGDLPVLPLELVPEADAILGVRRRAHRRGVFVGYTAGAASEAAAMSHQQAATQQPAPAQQQAAPAAPAAPPPAATDKPLPLGTVVSALPPGCTSTPVGGVEYYYCGGNFYRAVFQGNQLVYVTAKPE